MGRGRDRQTDRQKLTDGIIFSQVGELGPSVSAGCG